MAAESPAAEHLAYETVAIPLGVMGVNLTKSLDQLDPNELARMTNVFSDQGAGVNTRPGQTVVVPPMGTSVHSIARLNTPSGTFTRFWGCDLQWLRGAGPAVPTAIEGGFSGNPLSMVAWDTELGTLSKLYVADTNKMRVAGITSTSQPIGLPKPLAPLVTADAIHSKTIASFAAGDASAAANWFGSAGQSTGGIPPILSALAGPDGNGVNMASVVDVGALAALDPPGTWSMWMNLPRTLDLSTFGGGVAATDDDIIHLYIRMDDPAAVDEIRVYLICSVFNQYSVPGTVSLLGNTSSYVRSYRPSDYTDFVALSQSAAGAAETIRTQALLDGSSDPIVTDALAPSTAGQPGANIWMEFGKIDLPIRRADFFKIGEAGKAGIDWSTITGICVFVQSTGPNPVNIAFDQLTLLGGKAIDTSEPDAQPLDYRVTNYDTLTGAEGNPSNVMTTTLDVMRQSVTIQPVPYGRVGVVQRAYRRGGVNVDNWYGPVAQSTTDGGAMVDNTDDTTALATGTVAIDHDQPITSVDGAGNAIYNQPVPVLFGPIEGYLFALGDPNRAGTLYWSKQGEPNHWPSTNYFPVCASSEALQNGGKYGGQGYVFSTNRLYSIQVNLIDGTVSTSPTDCSEGLAGRWAQCTGPGGIYFVANDAVRVTQGGASHSLSDNIRPLFRGQAVNGYNPIDFTVPNALRLSIAGDDLWFGFQDSTAARVWWVYSLLYKTWRFVQFAAGKSVGCVYAEKGQAGGLSILFGALTTGKGYLHAGTTDDELAIPCRVRTGALDLGRRREEKLLGDLCVWADMDQEPLTLQCFLNQETVTNTAIPVSGGAAPARYIFDVFGTTPQHAQTLSVDLTWNGTNGASPAVSYLTADIAIEPAITMNRATTWQPLNEKGEAYLTGCYVDSDTGGSPRTILVEGLLNGTPVAVATLTVTSTAGRRQWFSWTAVHVDMVRLRPTGNCEPWMLYGCDWLSQPEPARVSTWDTSFEAIGDSYYTGLMIECDTFGVNKTIAVMIDQVVVTTFTVNCNGRQLLHFPFGGSGSSYGREYRFYATDANVGLLYSHRWHTTAQPATVATWDTQPEDLGDPGDKYIAGVLLECMVDAGQTKTVQVLIDEVVVDTLSVTAAARQTNNYNLTGGPYLGKVVRLHPIDTNRGRLWGAKWLWEKKPDRTSGFAVQNWSILSTLGDKWIKGVIIECDTSNVAKSVDVEADGVVVTTLAVQANGRQVLNFSFAQILARVIRLRPTDTNPGKLYSRQWIFDEEPYKLTRYETQEQPDGIADFHLPVGGQIAIKSSGVVTMQSVAYGQSGQILSTKSYALPSTAGVKSMISLHIFLEPQKGLLYKFLFTAAAGFWLYREESWIDMQPWSGGGVVRARVFGDDDLSDVSRPMRHAEGMAAKSGGSSVG